MAGLSKLRQDTRRLENWTLTCTAKQVNRIPVTFLQIQLAQRQQWARFRGHELIHPKLVQRKWEV
jgi:hypothetical protein